MRRSGWILVLAGLVGAAFFIVLDPRWGWVKLPANQNPIDAAHEAIIGTVVGLAGSTAVLLTGLWLVIRRSL